MVRRILHTAERHMSTIDSFGKVIALATISLNTCIAADSGKPGVWNPSHRGSASASESERHTSNQSTGSEGGLQPYSAYVGGGKNIEATHLAVDRFGNTFVTGRIFKVPRSTSFVIDEESPVDVFVTRLDPAGREVFTLVFGGGGYDGPSAIAVGLDGTAYVVGTTYSRDFPATSGFQPVHGGGSSDGFICNLGPLGASPLLCSYLGGERNDGALAIAVDDLGNAFVTGSTGSEDFPVTPSAFQTTPDPPNSFASPSDAFVTKLSPNLSLLYSTRLGGKSTYCSGGSSCIPAASADVGTSIAVDAAGQAVVAGMTNSFDFPTTPFGFQDTCSCSFRRSDGFVAKLDPAGTELVFSTFLGGSAVFEFFPEETVTGVTLDAAGNAYVVGSTSSPDFPTTPGAFQPLLDAMNADQGRTAGFVTKLDPSGTQLVFSSFLQGVSRTVGAGLEKDTANSVAVDLAGNIYVSGRTRSEDFPVATGAPSRGEDFFVKFNRSGSTLLYASRLPGGSAGVGTALDGRGGVYLLGESGFVSRSVQQVTLSGERVRIPAILGVGNAAGLGLSGAGAPGELISIFGVRLGPQQGTALVLDDSGRVSTTLAGSQVLFDGVPAPLTWVQGAQINAIVPFGASPGTTADLRIIRGDQSVGGIRLTIVPAAPEIFRIDFLRAAALNQDGSLNSPDNPARPGSIVSLFATGSGLTDPPSADGEIAKQPLPRPRLPISVQTADAQPLDILYAGAAPGLVAGVLQVNVRLPEGNFFPQVTLILEAGEFRSSPVWISVASD